MKKIFLRAMVCSACIALGAVLGSSCHTVAMQEVPAKTYTESEWEKLANAWKGIAWTYYQFKDYEDFDWETGPERRFTFWDDCISETPEYDVIYEITGGDFGDFFEPVEW